MSVEHQGIPWHLTQVPKVYQNVNQVLRVVDKMTEDL